MNWSTKIAQVAGIGIYIHWTFWLLILWIGGMYVMEGGTAYDVARGVGFVFAIFGCVVLHELGHSLAARRYNIQTRDITLLPIGGVARLERMPEEPLEELRVALAGPAVNVVIATILFAVVASTQGLSPFLQFQLVEGNFLVNLMWINLWLVAFNLIPAFPMDGGRVLRALLATRLDYARATQFAATVGQGMAILFALVGLLTGIWMLLFIALFVFLGAQQESHAAQIKSLLRDVPVRAAMVTRFRTLSEHDRMPVVLEELLAGYQQDFPVMTDGRLVGILTRTDLMQALAEGRQGATVGEVMRRDCVPVSEGDMLERTFQRMREAGCPALPVMRQGELVGLVTLENVGEWMMINSAIHSRGARSEFDSVFREVQSLENR
jgi:Zn-dependent protease